MQRALKAAQEEQHLPQRKLNCQDNGDPSRQLFGPQVAGQQCPEHCKENIRAPPQIPPTLKTMQQCLAHGLLLTLAIFN